MIAERPHCCEAYTFDGIESKRCTRPASVDRDGHRACAQHGRLSRVSWVYLALRGDAEPPRHRPWWETIDPAA